MEFTNLFEKLLNELVETIFPTFIKKRAEGAKKIEESTRKKGSFSILTAYHYAGKVKPYADALKISNKEDKESHFKEKYKEAHDKLKDLDSLSQKEFQMIAGILETYGEVYIQSKHPKDYSK
jgi:hypothetical protein